MIWNVFKGRCMFIGWNGPKIVFLAAVTGSIHTNNLKIEKTFYDERSTCHGMGREETQSNCKQEGENG